MYLRARSHHTRRSQSSSRRSAPSLGDGLLRGNHTKALAMCSAPPAEGPLTSDANQSAIRNLPPGCAGGEGGGGASLQASVVYMLFLNSSPREGAWRGRKRHPCLGNATAPRIPNRRHRMCRLRLCGTYRGERQKPRPARRQDMNRGSLIFSASTCKAHVRRGRSGKCLRHFDLNWEIEMPVTLFPC